MINRRVEVQRWPAVPTAPNSTATAATLIDKATICAANQLAPTHTRAEALVGRHSSRPINNISRPDSCILFVGYQAVGTLGRRIVQGEKEVRILGKTFPVKADVKQITGFSAHADRDELLKWLKVLKQPKHVFITHGEASVSESFATFVKAQTGWETSVPKHGDEVVLE